MMDDHKDKKGTKEPIMLNLSRNEAIVLFDLLCRINKDERQDLFEDQAEQRVLWNLECLLERELVEPFWDDYNEILIKCRDELRDPPLG